MIEAAENVVAAVAWWLLAGNFIVLGFAALLEFAPRIVPNWVQRMRNTLVVWQPERASGATRMRRHDA